MERWRILPQGFPDKEEKRNGAFRIEADGEVKIGGILFGARPQMGMQYFDKTGHFLQGHSLNGVEFTVTAMGYDGCGRAVFHTKPVRYMGGLEREPLRFRESFIASMDEKGVLHGEAAEAHPEDGGYPYAGQKYEDRPNGRLIESGAPGRILSMKGEGETAHTTRYAYGCNEEGEDGLPFPAGKYYKTKITNPNGDVTCKYQDSRGEQGGGRKYCGINSNGSYRHGTDYRFHAAWFIGSRGGLAGLPGD